LEPRRLRSVTVSEGYPGFYEVTGDDSNDTIDISVSQSDRSFTLDGSTYSNVEYILVNGNGGDDEISVLSIDGAGLIAAAVSAGPGNDNITQNFDGGVWAGDGDDFITLSDAFRGVARGEGGNDQIIVDGACVDPQINGDDGDDLINCSSNLYRVVIHGGSGDDTIYGSAYDDEIYGDEGSDVMHGLGGDDTFYAQDGSIDRIIGGSGFDVAYADGNDQCGVEYVFLKDM
jgi:Ca2+-binding RTX toxin-like protein